MQLRLAGIWLISVHSAAVISTSDLHLSSSMSSPMSNGLPESAGSSTAQDTRKRPRALPPSTHIVGGARQDYLQWVSITFTNLFSYQS
jgi:hypothetical protein